MLATLSPWPVPAWFSLSCGAPALRSAACSLRAVDIEAPFPSRVSLVESVHMLLPAGIAFLFGGGLLLYVVSRRHRLASDMEGPALRLFTTLSPLIAGLILLGGSLMLHRDILLALRTFGAVMTAVGVGILGLTWSAGDEDARDEPAIFGGSMTAPDLGALLFIIGVGLLLFALIL